MRRPIVLKFERMKRGYTQKSLAEKLGFSQVFISQLEIGYRTPGKNAAKKLEEVFQMPADELMKEAQ